MPSKYQLCVHRKAFWVWILRDWDETRVEIGGKIRIELCLETHLQRVEYLCCLNSLGVQLMSISSNL